jgi:hypothetical protein
MSTLLGSHPCPGCGKIWHVPCDAEDAMMHERPLPQPKSGPAHSEPTFVGNALHTQLVGFEVSQ